MARPADRFSSLYRAYGPVIYARCRELLRDPAAAEDATHETFVRVQRHLARAPDDRSALFWIYRIATNYCLNQLRGEGRRSRWMREATAAVAPPVDPVGRLLDRDAALRLIEAAPEAVRVVACLYHLDGFEQEEVARILGVSRRTVATRLATFRASAQSLKERDE